MKNTTLLFLGLAVLWACNSNEPQKTVITGQVNVTWSNSANVHSGSISLTDEWSGHTDHRDTSIALDKDGMFRMETNISEPGFYVFSHEGRKAHFYLEPGDSLNIDLKDMASFSGSSGDENQHYSAMLDIIQGIESWIVENQRDFFVLNQQAYSAKLDSMKSAYLDWHESYLSSNSISTTLDQRIKNEIKYRDKFYRLAHPAIYNMYNVDEGLGVDESYFSQIAEGELDDPSLLSSPNFVLFLDRLVEIMSAGDLKTVNFYDAGIQQIYPRYRAIQNLNAHPTIKDYLYTEHLLKSMNNYGIAYFDGLMNEFERDCQNDQLREQVQTIYESKVERRTEADTILVYKQIGDVALEAHVFFPENEATDKGAYLFFHGGGWSTGIPEWGYTDCKRYRDKGMLAISFEYRLLDIHSSNIINCLEDANSAILWTREHSDFLGIDPEKIVAAGFSAGGHIAAGTAILDEFNIENEQGVNSKPNALIIHSATYNTTKGGFFRRQSNGNAVSISNQHQVKSGLVPGIYFHGTRDHLAPIPEFTDFRDKMDSLGNDYEYKIFEGVGHFFGDPQSKEEVRVLTEKFLRERGFIDAID